MHATKPTTHDVIVVGAGPVGLGLSLELALRGVRVTLLEKSDRVSAQPRAKLVNVRSMSLLRRWGVAAAARAAAPLGADWPGDIAFVTSLTGHEITRFSDALMTGAVPGDLAPEPALTIPQYALEEVLRERLRAQPEVAIPAGSEVVDLDDEGSRVAVTVRAADGEVRTLRARWVVGCDGARSAVRRRLGITMSGTSVIARNLGVVLRAPALAEALCHDPAVQYWVLAPRSPGIAGRLDRADTWWAQLTGFAEEADVLGLDLERHLRGMIGADLPLTVLGTDPWAARSLLADRYRVGRVLLAGDAAHLHPPMGGYGMNMGLGDAVDLGWKLAAVVHGAAPERLLDTYDTERRRVHRRVLTESTHNYGTLSHDLGDPRLADDGLVGEQAREALAETISRSKSREFRSLGLQLGVSYHDAATGDETDEQAVTQYVPRALPGHLAPHGRLDDGTSLYDRLGSGLTVLVRPDHPEAASWSAPSGPADAGLAVDVVWLSGECVERYPAPVTIVRPDQYVGYAGAARRSELPGLVEQLLGDGLIPCPTERSWSA